SVEWMGRNRPDVSMPPVSIQKHKMEYFDTVGIALSSGEYIEINKLKQSYAELMKYIEWARTHEDLKPN
ncbi:MAG: hypothetical protein AAGH40_10635, partial [Verrucomicrobiota bacterium]